MTCMGRRIIALMLVLAGVSADEAAGSVTLFVNSADDQVDVAPGDGVCATASGWCTVRAAIIEANTLPGSDSIHFGISSGIQRISIARTLPTITDPVLIDGWTQPGFAGAPLLILDGRGGAGSGLTIAGGATTIRGLVIQGFPRNGVTIKGSGGNVIEGNYIGTDEAGMLAVGNGSNGLLIDKSRDNRIGGPSPAQRNVISGNLGEGHDGGIQISGSQAAGNVVQGNFIGTDVTGLAALPNRGRGVAVSQAPQNLIGGAGPGEGNVISANRATGVRILGAAATGNVVQGNWIGVDRDGRRPLSNDRGVQIRSANGNQVLGNKIVGNRNDGVILMDGASDNLVADNVVAYNGFGPQSDPVEAGFSGIKVVSGTGNMLTSNSVFENALLGIDLSQPNGITPNDVGDLDTGANELQNFPTLTSATRFGAALIIEGSLDSAAMTIFSVELFASPACDPSGEGEGRYPIGEVTVATNAAGQAVFTVSVPSALAAGWVITSTATDPAGNTSEFSACVTIE